MSKRKQSDTCTIPSIELTEAEQGELRGIMSRGNTILIGHARRLFGPKSKSGRMLREALHKTTKHDNELATLWGKSIGGKTGREIGEILGISPEDLDAIYAVRDVEFKLICGYMAMVRSLTYKILDSLGWTGVDVDDVIMEGIDGLRRAIYNYRDTDILFLTFAHTCVRRSILRTTLSNNGLGGISDRAIKLVRRYRKAEKAAGLYATEDDIFELTGMNASEIDDVRTLIRGVVRDTDMTTSEGSFGIGESIVDYRTGENPMSADWHEALQRANLSNIELELLMASLDGNYGFRSEIAEKHINPKTGNPYTRAGARVILERARQKVNNKMTKRQTRGVYTPTSQLAEVA